MKISQNRHYSVTSVMRIYGFPPFLVPVEDLEGFEISPDGAVEFLLKASAHRQAQEFCMTYSPEVTGRMKFGKIDSVRGLFLSKNNVSMPVDSMEVVWDAAGEESLEIVMGPARVTLPGSAFGHMNSRSRLPTPHSPRIDTRRMSRDWSGVAHSTPSPTGARAARLAIDVYCSPRTPSAPGFRAASNLLMDAAGERSRSPSLSQHRKSQSATASPVGVRAGRTPKLLSSLSAESPTIQAKVLASSAGDSGLESPTLHALLEEEIILNPMSFEKSRLSAQGENEVIGSGMLV